MSNRPLKCRSVLALIALLGFGIAAEVAYAEATYEPSYRARMRRESCMNDESEQGVYCVKNCQKDFVLQSANNRPVCKATKGNAKYVAPADPGWEPKPRPADWKPAPGA